MEERDFAFHDEYSRELPDYHKWSDNDLVAICREGDVETYEPLVRRYAHDVYRMTYALVGNSEDAFDLTEETFIAGYPQVRKYEAHTPYSVVLFQTAIEKSKRLLRGEGLYAVPDPGLDLDRDWRNSGNSCPGGMCSVGARKTRQSLESLIAHLPTPEKLVFVLRDVVGFSVEQVTRVLEWPVRKVKAKLAAARITIYRALHPEFELTEIKRCQRSVDFLSDYLEGLLHPRLYDELSEHFRECKDCSDDLKKMEEALRDVSNAMTHKMPGDIWHSVLSRLTAGETPEVIRERKTRPRMAWWKLVAYITLLLSFLFGGGKIITENLESAKQVSVHQVQKGAIRTTPAAPVQPSR